MDEDRTIKIKVYMVGGKDYIFICNSDVGIEILKNEIEGEKWLTLIDQRNRRIWMRFENIASIDLNYGMDEYWNNR